jgi:hypothetical protein
MLPQSHNPDHIGIWERKDENGKTSFVRRMDALGEWHFWASLGRIEPKGKKRRVVLIGESVAEVTCTIRSSRRLLRSRRFWNHTLAAKELRLLIWRGPTSAMT